MPAAERDLEEDPEPSSSCLGPFSCAPVDEEFGPGLAGPGRFATWRLWRPLLFDNEASDARDHCANERTFLASLKLSVYMSVVAVAISVSFHLRAPPSALERRVAKPLGLIFWLLSVACLLAGLGNYVTTVDKYGRRVAIVQSGWRTQIIMSIIAFSIFATCVTLLVVNQRQLD
ncbi:hypothetical protein F5X97DRAFT_290204 [Nemania serpens]|nr:hypothetical protein F5X97DRAFT_290204 [Nemania serpens]